jgi:cytidylate kinase
MKPQRVIVTIDGPAGVGKSTVAKLLAKALEVMYLDTGATYRSLAYAAVEANVNIADRERLVAMAKRLPLQLRQTAEGELRVLLDGKDVTKKIRTEEVSEAAAHVAQEPKIREALVALQRRLADEHGVVVEGRDTGSVVFPYAPHKFFLDAQPDIRAKRRQDELALLYGRKTPLLQVQEQLHFRDSLDRTRRVGPLVKPEGAIVIDTSHLSASDVVRVMLKHIRAAGGQPAS